MNDTNQFPGSDGGVVDSEGSPMTPVTAIAMLLGVVVVIGAFFMLAYGLGIGETWPAFIFLMYWAGIQHMDFSELRDTVCGSLFGVLLVYLAAGFPLWLGAVPGGAAFLGLSLAVVYCLLMGHFKPIINMMAMLFLTVGTIPAMTQGFVLLEVLKGLALGIFYFSGLFWGMRILGRLRESEARQEAG